MEVGLYWSDTETAASHPMSPEKIADLGQQNGIQEGWKWAIILTLVLTNLHVT